MTHQSSGLVPPLTVLALSPTALVSGAERVLIDYARDGVARGEKWSLACPPGPLVEFISDTGIRWIQSPELRLSGGSRARSMMSLAGRNLSMTRLLRQIGNDFDVVVANSVMSLPALVPARLDPPVCWLVHDVITRSDLKAVAKFGARAVTLAIAVSNASMELSAQLGIRSCVVRNGVKWPVPLAHLTSDPPIIGINAVLTEWKGHRVFLEALSKIDAPFLAEILGGTFPGDMQYEAELRSMTTALGLNDRVRFVGHSDSPLEEMRRWSIAVSASVEPEAGPLAVLEAMSLGVPVVVTNHGGSPEVSSDVGVTVKPGDAAEMAAALSALLDDPQRQQHLGALGRTKVEERYSIARSRAEFAQTISTEVHR